MNSIERTELRALCERLFRKQGKMDPLVRAALVVLLHDLLARTPTST